MASGNMSFHYGSFVNLGSIGLGQGIKDLDLTRETRDKRNMIDAPIENSSILDTELCRVINNNYCVNHNIPMILFSAAETPHAPLLGQDPATLNF